MTDSQKIKKIEKLLSKWKNQLEKSKEDTKIISAKTKLINELDEILNPKPVIYYDPNQITVEEWLAELQMEQREQN